MDRRTDPDAADAATHRVSAGPYTLEIPANGVAVLYEADPAGDDRQLPGGVGYLDALVQFAGEIIRLQAMVNTMCAEAQSAWRSVATAIDQNAAPWDGVPVLIVTNHNWGGPANRVHRAFWTDEIHGNGIFGWAVHDNKFGPYPLRGYTQVTHWMPLPNAPEVAL